MTTTTLAPTAAQLSPAQAEALAIAMASSNPMLRWERPEVREALGTIDLSQWPHNAPERVAILRVWRHWHATHSDVAGIGLSVLLGAWDESGEIVVEEAFVSSVEEFVAAWGEPATHARAQEIAETRLAELSSADRNRLEDDIARKSNENAFEAHCLRNV